MAKSLKQQHQKMLSSEKITPVQGGNFKLWIKDRQIRPCFGTIELKDSKRCTVASLVGYGGVKLRVITLLNVLKVANIPLNQGAMTYNVTHMRSDLFHLKYAVPHDLYCSNILKTKPSSPISEILKKRYEGDYYGSQLRHLYSIAGDDNKVTIDNNLIFAKTHEELLKTGPVVLYNKSPIKCDNLAFKEIEDFERAVNDKLEMVGNEDVFFSVCFYAENSAEKAENSDEVASSDIFIGARIDWKVFLSIFPSLLSVEAAKFLQQHYQSQEQPNISALAESLEKSPSKWITKNNLSYAKSYSDVKEIGPIVLCENTNGAIQRLCDEFGGESKDYKTWPCPSDGKLFAAKIPHAWRYLKLEPFKATQEALEFLETHRYVQPSREYWSSYASWSGPQIVKKLYDLQKIY